MRKDLEECGYCFVACSWIEWMLMEVVDCIAP